MLDNKDMELKLKNDLFVLYDKTKNSIVLYDKDNEEEKLLSGHLANILFVERLNDFYFISGSDDGVIKIWNFNGKCVSTIDNDQSEILGYYMFANSFLYILKNDKIVLINFQGKIIYEINEQVESLDNIRTQSYIISILSDNNLSIYKKLNGQKIATFKNRNKFIDAFFLLSNRSILGRTGSEIFLYSADGELIRKFDKAFSLSQIIELNDEKFASLSGNEIVVFDKNGELVSCSDDVELVENFKKLISAFDELDKLKTEKTKIEQFPHISSPYQKVIKDIESILEKQSIDFNDPKYDKNVWDFFNRPLFGYIKRLLKKDENASKKFIKTSLKYKKDSDNKIKELNSNIEALKSSKNFSFNTALVIMIFVVSLLIFVKFAGISEQIMYISISVSFVCFILSIFLFKEADKKKKEIIDLDKKIKIIDSYISTMDIIKNRHIAFIGDLRKYRNSILKQFPIVSNPNLFDGSYVKNYTEELINNKIAQIAMDECGVLKDDIIQEDKKPIILNEWSFIQKDTSKVDPHNIRSFWGSPNGFSFATQFLQYIFLTKDKIDVFNTHYDFIQNKTVRKEARAFYYKDVTNITKKEIEREVFGEKIPIPAIEIILKVSSGDSIELTILDNKDMVSSHDNEEESESLDFEAERNRIREDDSISQEDKEEELKFIDAQEQQSRTIGYKLKNSQENISKADRTIQNIRAQINIHKQQQ